MPSGRSGGFRGGLPPGRVAGGVREGAYRLLGGPVGRNASDAARERGERGVVLRHPDREQRLAGVARRLGGGAHRLGDVLRLGDERRDEDGDDGVHGGVAGERLDRLPVVVGRRRGDHVDRVRRGRLARADAVPAGAGSWSAAGRPSARPPRRRRRRRCRGRPRWSRRRCGCLVGSGWPASSAATSNSSPTVAVRITPACRNRASTVASEAASSAPVCEVAAREPAAERPLLTAMTGLLRGDPPGDLPEPARVAERLQVQADHVGLRRRSPRSAAGRCRRGRPCCRSTRTRTGRDRGARPRRPPRCRRRRSGRRRRPRRRAGRPGRTTRSAPRPGRC